MHDPIVRREIVGRVEALEPDAVPGWGSMTAAVMLFHVNAGMRIALGELLAEPIGDPVFWHTKGKAIALGEDPWPQGAPTSREALPDHTVELEPERRRFAELIEAIAGKDRNGEWPAHPRLGPLTGAEWSRLTFTHVRHHLRQFGVWPVPERGM